MRLAPGDASAQLCDPLRNRLFGALSGLAASQRDIGGWGDSRVLEFNAAPRNSSPKCFNAARGHARIANIQRGEFLQALQPGEARIRDVRPVQIQLFEVRKGAKRWGALIREQRAEYV